MNGLFVLVQAAGAQTLGPTRCFIDRSHRFAGSGRAAVIVTYYFLELPQGSR